jgi:hypothetical protein
MSSYPELAGVVTLVFTSCVAALLAYRTRREIFDPRVFFVLLYAYMTLGPCLFAIVTSEPYHPGLKVNELNSVLYSCTTAVIGFSLGATIALRGTPLRKFDGITPRFRQDQLANAIVRAMLVACCVTTMVLMVYYGYLMRSSVPDPTVGKAYLLRFADPGVVRSFRFFSSGCLLFQTLFVIAESVSTRKFLSPRIVLIVGAYTLICFVNGERDVLIVIAVWLTTNWKKMSRSQILLAATASILWLGLTPMLRRFGLGWENQISAVQAASFMDWLHPVMHMSSNLHVYTNVVDAVPSIEGHWFGRSLLSSLMSFVPGDFALKQETPAWWFSGVYDHQGLAGYGFSQDAEAYLNFGWVGPPLWFAVWGYLLALAYRRTIVNPRTLNLFVWWHMAATSAFAIRSDTRGLFKMVVLGIAAAVVIRKVAEVIGYLEARKLSNPRRSLPHFRRANEGPK